MATSTRVQKKNFQKDVPQENKEAPDREYIKEYYYALLLGVVFCLSVAIITYDPSDPSHFNINSNTLHPPYEVTNTFGAVGAFVADWCFQFLGFGAIIFSMVFIVQILSMFRKPKGQSRFWLRIFGYPQLIICYLGLLSLIAPTSYFRGISLYTGGAVGHFIAQFLVPFIGRSGALFALSVGFLASLTLCLGIRPFATVAYLLNFFPSRKAKNFIGTVKDLENENLDNSFEEVYQKSESSFEQYAHQAGATPTVPVLEEKLEANAEQIKPGEELNSLLLLLHPYEKTSHKNFEDERQKLNEEALRIEEKLATFGVKGTVIHSQTGPVVNVHEFEPSSGIKINKIISLQDDLMLALKAQSVLIDLQPGKSSLGIEVPAAEREIVSLREIMESTFFQNPILHLPLALGKNVDGSPLVADLAAMPHLLVAGATGSGKSVCIHSMLLSLMMTKTPRELRLILIDPKMLELACYDGIGHLLMPVVTEADKAADSLQWAIEEMERRYQKMRNCHVRNIHAYNSFVESDEAKENDLEKLPYIVIMIDELCDLMMSVPKEIEEGIQRLAQKARAAGIHLVLATQRPSTDVLTGVIKANLPCRLSFQVASRYDSKTIIESVGAEHLLGKGDMLFLPPGISRTVRAQCSYASDEEIQAVADKLRALYPTSYKKEMLEGVKKDLNRQKNDKIGASATFSPQNNDEIIDENALYDKSMQVISRNYKEHIQK